MSDYKIDAAVNDEKLRCFQVMHDYRMKMEDLWKELQHEVLYPERESE